VSPVSGSGGQKPKTKNQKPTTPFVCLAMMRKYPRFRTASADEAQKDING
jgi:hypothetical protein